MKVTYDREADAIYIGLRDADVARSSDVAEGMIVDYDDAGEIVGIEILRASARTENPQSILYTFAPGAEAASAPRR